VKPGGPQVLATLELLAASPPKGVDLYSVHRVVAASALL
jgi:hypothetical protein